MKLVKDWFDARKQKRDEREDLSVRRLAITYAMRISDFDNPADSDPGDSEDALEVVTAAQVIYDYLTGKVNFDYDHLFDVEDDDLMDFPPDDGDDDDGDEGEGDDIPPAFIIEETVERKPDGVTLH